MKHVKFTRMALGFLRRIGRATAYASLASKLLVPVGFMPAAFADGGPIRLCAMQFEAAVGHMHDPAEGGHHRASPDHDRAHHHEHDRSHPKHDPESDHGPWERCALGALASLAALAGEMALPVDFAGSPERVAVDTTQWASRAAVAVRARGPPAV